MTLTNHKIKEQYIDITFNSNDNTYELQDRIKTIYLQRIIPLLNILFNNSCVDNTLIRIDKLVVDAGSFNKAELENEFPRLTICAVIFASI